MYTKDYDGRNKTKQYIQRDVIEEFPIHKREIWYVKLGCNIGYEEDGKGGFERPVLVINKIGNVYFCLPLTTKGKDDHLFYHAIQSVIFDRSSYVILSQGRVLDKKRFVNLIGKISPEEFLAIKKKLATRYS